MADLCGSSEKKVAERFGGDYSLYQLEASMRGGHTQGSSSFLICCKQLI
jgi:hypothetical protein